MMSNMVFSFYHVAVAEGGDFAARHAPGAFAAEFAAEALVGVFGGVVVGLAADVAHLITFFHIWLTESAVSGAFASGVCE